MRTAPERRRFSFPRARRVRKRAEFLRVQDAPGIRVRSAAFLVLGGRRGEGPTRVGIVASKRLGGAVRRNRAKRLLREVLRRRLASLPEGLDLVVIAQAPLFRRPMPDLERDFDRAMRDLARFALRPA